MPTVYAESMLERYFDYAATTPVDSRVVREMLPFLEGDFGNPNSIHGFGSRARAAVELARQRVADLIGAEDPSQIIFTSGATEANNWVASMFSDNAWISPFEHSAMREPALRNGWSILPNDGLDISSPPEAQMVSIMTVNNEIGAIWPVDIQSSVIRHADVTQQVGKLPTTTLGLDFASFSAHKFYGPKGVGALYATRPPDDALVLGGEQEHGYRGGTLNVPGIVGMGAAAAIAFDELDRDAAHASDIEAIIRDGLTAVSDWINPAENVENSPYIIAASFADVEGETLVIEMDQAGFAISSGAACSTGSTEPSHVLTALGLDERFLRGTVRISTGRFTQTENAAELAKILPKIVEKLRRMKQVRLT